jgi:hypothetical protein
MDGGDFEVGLRIAPRSDPIAWSVRLPDGSASDFEGYMQLIALLEQLRTGPVPEPSTEGSRG